MIYITEAIMHIGLGGRESIERQRADYVWQFFLYYAHCDFSSQGPKREIIVYYRGDYAYWAWRAREYREATGGLCLAILPILCT